MMGVGWTAGTIRAEGTLASSVYTRGNNSYVSGLHWKDCNAVKLTHRCNGLLKNILF